MLEQNIWQSLFVAFAFTSQVLLIFNFATLKWKPHIQRRWGWIVYAAGMIALPLAVLFWMNGLAWYFQLAFALYMVWAIFGSIVDILKPVNWRAPIRWSIFLTYVILYIAAQFSFWIPLWFVWLGYWIVYTALYMISTVLNISTHFQPNNPVAGN
jgi:hypothetical protein